MENKEVSDGSLQNMTHVGKVPNFKPQIGNLNLGQITSG